MSTKLRNILVLVLVIVVGLALWLILRKKENDVFNEYVIARKDVIVSIMTTGTVSPENRVEIKPPVAGRIEEVLVEEGQRVRKGQVLAWLSSSERAALIDSARARGPEELKEWESLYKPTPIIAPISGTIILRSVESGQSFTTSEAVLVMSDRLTVKALFDETDLAKVRTGQKAEIHLDAYPQEAVQAKVGRIAYEAKTTSNVTTYSVDINPDVVPDFMRSGMTANISVRVDGKENVPVIENSILRYAEGLPHVLIRRPDEQVIEIPLKLGLSDGRISEVIEGVNEGDVVLEKVLTSPGAEPASANPFGPPQRRKKSTNSSQGAQPKK